MKLNIDLLKKICEVPGAPGFETPIRNQIIKEIKSHVDSYDIDNMGNLIAIKKGNKNPDGKKVMVAAHMDEIGFIVTHIDSNGFVRFHTLGGFDPKTLTAQRVIIHGKEDVIGVMGSKPIHVMTPDEKNKVAKTSDYFIDLGMAKDEVEKLISIGDSITRERGLIEMGNCVNCKSIDNRVSVFILIETIKKLQNIPFDLYAVFSTQEEVGLRGASVAAHRIDPDFGIALDTTIAYDLPGAQPHEEITKLGDGTAIKIMDAMTICDTRMVNYLKERANEEKIKWQTEILTVGGTDTAGIQRRGEKGAISGAISIPTRHLHQVIEMAHKEDISSSIDLLKSALENLDSYDWNW
ncbi:M42 family metallopeptidase [Reichenbachiella sp. MALMAid0571]|uniref:M42 family metallopeptidase n=1 Tax=Reichenbachiella sp. MALMAid0571 TaxID=3143939 RepID=UPI0032DF6AE7